MEVEIGQGPSGMVELRVIDHGPGLDPATAQRVFERFYRGDPGRARDSGGTGLGLSIVWSLVAAHDGSIEVVPTAEGGSTFVVRLPAGGPQVANPTERPAVFGVPPTGG